MYGGIAVTGKLLCVSYTDVRGKLFLVDLEDFQVISRWSYSGGADSQGNSGNPGSSGNPGNSGNPGPSDSKYADAGGVAMDGAYTIFVADTAGDQVRRFTAFGREVGRIGRQTDRGAGAASRDKAGLLDRPVEVAVHGHTLFVGCGDRKLVRGVQRYDYIRGRMLSPLRSCGDSEGRFGAPRGLHVSDQRIHVADTLHGVIQRFHRDGRFVCEIPTSLRHDEASRPVAVLPLSSGGLLVADQGDAPGLRLVGRDDPSRAIDPNEVGCELDEPTGLAADDRGRIYVLDRGGERVQRLNPDLTFDAVVVDLREVGFEF